MNTKNRFHSVEEMVSALDDGKEFSRKLEKRLRERKVVDFLVAKRVAAKVTQAEIAGKMGVTQSAVSKLEHSGDEELTLKDILAYADLSGCVLHINLLPKERNAVDSIKYHFFKIRQQLEKLTVLANDNKDEKFTKGISDFFCEAGLNFLLALLENFKNLPRKRENEIVHISSYFDDKDSATASESHQRAGASQHAAV